LNPGSDAIQPGDVPGLSSSSSSNGLASAFNQLATNLKSGNLWLHRRTTPPFSRTSSNLPRICHHYHSAGSAVSSRRIPSNSFFPDSAKICNREIFAK